MSRRVGRVPGKFNTWVPQSDIFRFTKQQQQLGGAGGNEYPWALPDSSFQITLPSNASLDIFQYNRPNASTTQVCKELNVKGECEAAIIDIQFPRSWPNIL